MVYTQTPTNIQSFLGLVGYYMMFVEIFSYIPSPLVKFTKKLGEVSMV